MARPSELTVIKQDTIVKRLFSLWVIIYILVFILTAQGGISFSFYEQAVLWVGKDLLGLQDLHRIPITGSGDTTYNYVLLLVNVFLSFIFSIIIIIIDNKRKNYKQLYLFAIVIARYYMAFMLLSYGFSKIFNGQFPPNSYLRLEEKVGDMSPMGMVWAFMGASRGYTFFAGLLEVVGGFLLLFRKTKTFGALFSMTVMLNVVMLNFMYDVPVKIFSTHLVLLCLFILSYDWVRLYHFFISHRYEKLEYNKLHVKKRWMQISLKIIKVFLVAFIFYNNIHLNLYRQALVNKKAPMSGTYIVQAFILNEDTLWASHYNPDTVSWAKMILAYPKSVAIKYNDGKTAYKKIIVDTAKKTFEISDYNSLRYAMLHYVQDQDTVIFTGNIQQDTTEIVSIKKQMKDYRLVNRGFHWINEYPLNR